VPFSAARTWAIPQSCLGEIVTVITASEQPPTLLEWRGETIPVMDLEDDGDAPWRDSRAGCGLVAVLLGQQGEACRYWGVAIRGEGLGIGNLNDPAIEDLPDAVGEYATAAFSLAGRVCEVPDLLALQRAAAQAYQALDHGVVASASGME
jgi:hypothetical protein